MMASKTIKKESSSLRNKLCSPTTKNKQISKKEARRRIDSNKESEEEMPRATSYEAMYNLSLFYYTARFPINEKFSYPYLRAWEGKLLELGMFFGFIAEIPIEFF